MATGKEHKIAVIMGDGIGNEVVPEGTKVLDVAGERFGFKLAWTSFPWSCEHYQLDRGNDAEKRAGDY